jgi:Holliday junction resolvase RusA-like endonuclease
MPFPPAESTTIMFAVGFQTVLVADVVGRPASLATAAEAAWKAAVREAIQQTGLGPWTAGRFSVLLQFRTPAPRNTNEVWDLDNLIKPTLDAMEGVFGLRPWNGPNQAADDRVDHLEACKRTVNSDELPGARIEVRLLIQ